MIRALRGDQKQAQRVALMAAGACALTGVVMAARPELGVFVAAGAMLVALSLDWRRGVVALLVVLAFAGLPVFVAGTPGLAARDLFVIAPLYLAFGWAMLRSDESMLPPLGVALPALAIFAAVVVAGVARAPSLTVGVIGAKVWLAYVPMLAIGYHYVRSAADLERALRVTAFVGLVPASIALIEWLLATRSTGNGYVWINDFGPFSKMYGSWFEQVKWSGVAFGPDADHIVIPRVPSTFTGSSQYYGFALVAFASAMALALRTRATAWMLCAAMLGLACIASGVRASYLAAPAMLALTLMLAGTNLRHVAYAAAAIAVIVLAGSMLGASPLRVAGMMPAHAYQQFGTAWHELTDGITAAGHGTGWDTNSALRYGGATERRFVENWYAKASLELGLVGLASIVVAFAAIGVRLAAPLRRLDAGARPLAGALLALLGITAVSLFKGPYIDLDPLNVYFWLFAGMLLGLYRAAGTNSSASDAEVAS